MNLQDLQDQLRTHIRARIGRGELSGVTLARAADFPQGHLSNFLNARRGLSLESMDRLLETLDIGVLDLVDTGDIQRRFVLPRAGDAVEKIAVVSAENAALARFAPDQILETRSFNKSFLRRLKITRNAVSLGGVESLACHPKTTTHSGMTPQELEQAGIGEGLVRVSVGIEDWRDLLSDFEQALG